MSAITSGWMVYPVLILLAGGGIALPALQGIISAGASAANQGKTTGCAGQPDQSDRRGGPAAVCFIFSQTQQSADGTVWLDWHGTVRSAAGNLSADQKTGTGGGHLLTGAIQAALLCGMVDGIPCLSPAMISLRHRGTVMKSRAAVAFGPVYP